MLWPRMTASQDVPGPQPANPSLDESPTRSRGWFVAFLAALVVREQAASLESRSTVLRRPGGAGDWSGDVGHPNPSTPLFRIRLPSEGLRITT